METFFVITLIVLAIVLGLAGVCVYTLSIYHLNDTMGVLFERSKKLPLTIGVTLLHLAVFFTLTSVFSSTTHELFGEQFYQNFRLVFIYVGVYTMVVGTVQYAVFKPWHSHLIKDSVIEEQESKTQPAQEAS